MMGVGGTGGLADTPLPWEQGGRYPSPAPEFPEGYGGVAPSAGGVGTPHRLVFRKAWRNLPPSEVPGNYHDYSCSQGGDGYPSGPGRGGQGDLPAGSGKGVMGAGSC